MFNDTLIVQSAISTFNNAALFAPAFLINALFMLPIFAIIYVCGNTFLEKYKISNIKSTQNTSLIISITVAAWFILNGGNYSALRDNISNLPFISAAILFITSILIGIKTRKLNYPIWFGNPQTPRKQQIRINWICAMILILLIGCSDLHTWWGPILQIDAVLFGLFIGRHTKYSVPVVPCTISIIYATTIAFLMQPEFFRFGQIGNLTPIHLIWLLLVGFSIVLTCCAYSIPARQYIHNSAFIKLRWLFRFLLGLCIVIFFLTESVLIFLGTNIIFMALISLSIWHGTTNYKDLSHELYAFSIILFGILVGLPIVTALGILYLPASNLANTFYAVKKLL